MTAAVPSSPIDAMAQHSNERKRKNEDIGRNLKENRPLTLEDDFGLLQGVHTDVESQRVAQEAIAQVGPYPEPGPFDGVVLDAFGNTSPTQNMSTAQNQGIYAGTDPTPNASDDPKPSAGTPEWHKARKDSHKEVERRRREVINEGIENIVRIVPGTEKNKGAILQRTHGYILELQDKANKFDDERRLLQMAIDELTKRNESLRSSNRQAWNESNKWQQRCRDLGGEYDDYHSHGPQFDEANDLDPTIPPS